jgi:hypothetical protein
VEFLVNWEEHTPKAKSMHARRSVALLVETSNAYARGLLDGIIAYQREHELWSIYVGEQERGARPPVWMKNWKGDGVIARIETDAIASMVRKLGLPVVDVSAAVRDKMERNARKYPAAEYRGRYGPEDPGGEAPDAPSPEDKSDR